MNTLQSSTKIINTAEYQLQQLPWQPRHVASDSIR